MARILALLSITIALVLFPPAALALVSNNAVPGDATYIVKRKLEDGILLLASITPQTKAWFSVERSNRRFKEAAVLLTKNDQASTTLAELVDQTSAAAVAVTQVTDPVKKQELIEQLSQSIDQYNEGLSRAVGLPPTDASLPRAPIESEPTPTPSPTPEPTPGLAFSRAASSPSPTPVSTIEPTPVAMPIARISSPSPYPSLPPKPLPSPPTPDESVSVAASTPPRPHPTSPVNNQQQIEETQKKLEEIKKRLEEEREKEREKYREEHDRSDKEKKADRDDSKSKQSKDLKDVKNVRENALDEKSNSNN